MSSILYCAGPMGFDTGLLLANLLFSYLAQPGRNNSESHSLWILNETVSLFELFEEKFLSIWREKETEGSSDHLDAELLRACPASSSPQADMAKKLFLQGVWNDTVGFAGAELIRRIVGIAHVEDLDGIEDLLLRSQCEKRCLLLARHFMLQTTNDAYVSPVFARVRSPGDIRQVLEAVSKLDIDKSVWP